MRKRLLGLIVESISDTSQGLTGIRLDTDTTRIAVTGPVSRFNKPTVEQIAYFLIFVAAILTRFWDLGSRALHHDESEHAYYSWIYAIGGGYTHDPLLHGPFLFHANALITLLFGATDATARFMPAATGVAIVMLPWLLRGPKHLGRWGALSASVFLLFSPSILYYSRFIRHDVYTLIGTFLLFIGIVRYVERPSARWMLLAAGATGFLTTTKEVCFIVFFIFGIYLIVAAIWRIAPVLLGIGAAAGAAFLVVAKAMSFLGAPALPSIPWSNPTGAELRTFALDLIFHPLVIAALAIGALALGAAIVVLNRRKDPERGWIDSFTEDSPEESTAAALRAMLLDRRALAAAIGLGLLIYVVLYTSLFTNMIGLATGSFGALGYWLGQQGVQRGQEPWFYYVLLVPQYEFIGVILFPIACILLFKDTLVGWRRRIPFDHRWWVRLFIAFWGVMMFAILSWAGEKMPWLTVHIALPLILLSAMMVGDALGWLEQQWRRWRSRGRNDLLILSGALLTVGAVGLALLTWASDGPYSRSGNTLVHLVRPDAAAHWWLMLGLPVLAFLVVIGIGVARLGPRTAVTGLLVTTVVGLLLLQVHQEWRLTYREGDVPKDMLIYVQTSPYVPQVTHDLTQLSIEQTGNMSLNIWFDDITSWPFWWYLHNFTQIHYYGNQLPSQVSAPIVLMGSDNANTNPNLTSVLKNNYTMYQMPMRWWIPEEKTYREFAYAPDITDPSRQNYQDGKLPPFSLLDVARSVLHSIGEMRYPQEQGKIFRWVVYRELPAPVQSTNFRVYVRNDLVPEFDAIRYRNGG